MNWLKKLFGGGSKKKSSSRNKSRQKNKSRKKSKSKSKPKPKAKPRQSRRKSSAVTAEKTSSSRSRKSKTAEVRSSRRKPVKQESGQTFSNAFNLAQRDLPGIREADAAFRPQVQVQRQVEPADEAVDDRSTPVSLGQISNGRSPGIRRPS